MTFTTKESRRRALCAQRAVDGLSAKEATELEGLSGERASVPDEYELAAAAIYLACAPARTPMPRGLRQRIEQSALEHLGSNPD